MAYKNFIGFRYDEPERVKKHSDKWQQVITYFPLYEDRITKTMIIEFFKTKLYDLEIPALLGNCDACFMKGQAAIIAIYAEYPELAEKWIADEENNPNGYTYLKGITHKEMLETSKNIKSGYDLNKIEPKFNCACTA